MSAVVRVWSYLKSAFRFIPIFLFLFHSISVARVPFLYMPAPPTDFVVTEIGWGATTVSGNSVTVTLTKPAALGAFIVITAGFRDSSAAGFAITDSKGGVYNIAVQNINATGAASCAVIYRKTTAGNTLVAGDTITITNNGNNNSQYKTARVTTVEGLNALDSGTVLTQDFSYAQNNVPIGTPMTISTAGPITAQREYLVAVNVTGFNTAGTISFQAPWKTNRQYSLNFSSGAHGDYSMLSNQGNIVSVTSTSTADGNFTMCIAGFN